MHHKDTFMITKATHNEQETIKAKKMLQEAILQINYCEIDSDMEYDWDEDESEENPLVVVDPEDICDLLTRTRVRLTNKINLLAENEYTQDVFKLEYALLHFGFYTRLLPG